MSSIVLAGRSYRYGVNLLSSHLSSHFLPSTVQFVSLNSAIGRGIRKSKRVGFRGKERSQERSADGANKERGASDGLVRRTADISLSIPKGRMTHDAWRTEKASFLSERREELS